MVFFGDSITYGVGATSCLLPEAAGTCFADRAARFFDVAPVNAGSNGSTLESLTVASDPTFTTRAGINRYEADVLPHCDAANYLTILYGLNDVLASFDRRNTAPLGPDLFARDLDTVVTACHAAGMPYDHIRLIGLTTPDPAGSYVRAHTDTPHFAARRAAFTNEIVKEARRRQTRYASLDDAFARAGLANILADAVHPNDTGNALIAEAIEHAEIQVGSAPK